MQDTSDAIVSTLLNVAAGFFLYFVGPRFPPGSRIWLFLSGSVWAVAIGITWKLGFFPLALVCLFVSLVLARHRDRVTSIFGEPSSPVGFEFRPDPSKVCVIVENKDSRTHLFKGHFYIEDARNLDPPFTPNQGKYILPWDSGGEEKKIRRESFSNLALATFHEGPNGFDMKLREFRDGQNSTAMETRWNSNSIKRPAYKIVVVISIVGKTMARKIETRWLYPETIKGGLKVAVDPPPFDFERSTLDTADKSEGVDQVEPPTEQPQLEKEIKVAGHLRELLENLKKFELPERDRNLTVIYQHRDDESRANAVADVFKRAGWLIEGPLRGGGAGMADFEGLQLFGSAQRIIDGLTRAFQGAGIRIESHHAYRPEFGTQLAIGARTQDELRQRSIQTEDEVVPLLVEWANREGENLSVQLVNRTNNPICPVSTTVVDLAYWSGKAFQRDSKPKEVYVTGSVGADPMALGNRAFVLVRHEGGEFEFHSGEEPHTKVARDVEGLWMAVVHVKAEGIDEQQELFFSWYPLRKPPLQTETDPRN